MRLNLELSHASWIKEGRAACEITAAGSPGAHGALIVVKHLSVGGRPGRSAERQPGLGDGQRTELVIHGGGGTYRPSDDRVDPASIENLVAALRQPAVLKPDAGDLGIDQAWLDANAIPAALKNSGDFLEAAPNQQALYRRAFTDLNIIQKVVPSLYDYIKFDDYPSARIVVTFQDGSSVCATTRSYYLLMLPWEVVSGDHTDRTYNADLSRAVAALLPKQASCCSAAPVTGDRRTSLTSIRSATLSE